MSVACTSVCAPYACMVYMEIRRSEEDISSSGTAGVTVASEPNPGLPEDSQLLLTMAPSLQPLALPCLSSSWMFPKSVMGVMG